MEREPTDLTQELKTLRSLLRAAKDNPSLQKALIDSITKTSRAQDLRDILKSKWLHKSAVARIVQEVVSIVSTEVNDVDVIDRIVAKIAKIDVKNTASEAKQISLRKL